jgi:hypothetical protein
LHWGLKNNPTVGGTARLFGPQGGYDGVPKTGTVTFSTKTDYSSRFKGEEIGTVWLNLGIREPGEGSFYGYCTIAFNLATGEIAMYYQNDIEDPFKGVDTEAWMMAIFPD